MNKKFEKDIAIFNRALEASLATCAADCEIVLSACQARPERA